MSLARLVITAVKVEGRSKSEVARDYELSRYWVQQLVRRFETEGEAAYQPRSRRPHHSPNAVPSDMEDQIIRLRKELSKKGLDAGAETIRVHLGRANSHRRLPAVSTIWRVLTRRGFVTPQPQKRPRSSWIRFQADLPNERWQADITHWQLADGTEVEILNIEDDHSRLDICSQARITTTGARCPDQLPQGVPALRNPGWGAHRQRRGVHRQATRRRPGRTRGRTRCAGREIRPLPALPPADLRQGRAVPPDPEEVASRAAQGHHNRRAATPARPVPPLLQHRATTPRPRPAHPRPGLHRAPEGRPHRANHRPRTTGSAPTASTPPAP